MDKKYLIKYYENKIKIKINLRNGRFYEGHITNMDNNTFLFRDRYGEEIPIDYDAISYIVPVDRGKSGGDSYA